MGQFVKMGKCLSYKSCFANILIDFTFGDFSDVYIKDTIMIFIFKIKYNRALMLKKGPKGTCRMFC